MKRKILFFLFLVFASEVQAIELYEYNIPTRARGMGDVYSPFPEATDAIFVNPAYFAEVQEIGWDIVNVQAGLSDPTTAQSFQAISSGGTASYSALYGKSLWLGANGRSSMVLPFMGFAIYNNTWFSAGFNMPPFPDLNMRFLNDTGLLAGFGIPISPIHSVGVTLKKIQRQGGDQAIGLSTIAAGGAVNVASQFTDAGSAVGMDASIMMKLPIPLITPTFVATWKDVGCTAFTKTGGTDAPPRIQDNLILGTGLLMDLPGLDVRLGGEYRYAQDPNVQVAKKIHLGTEISLPLIDLRAGLSQGYQTYGAGLNLWFLKVDAAYYTVEKGEYPGQTPDVRYEASLSLQMSVDADFHFTSKDGKKRRLKQRR